MSKNFKLPSGIPVPPNFKKGFVLAFYHKPNWRERLKILVGFRVRMTIRAASEWSPGALHAEMTFETTDDLKPRV